MSIKGITHRPDPKRKFFKNYSNVDFSNRPKTKQELAKEKENSQKPVK